MLFCYDGMDVHPKIVTRSSTSDSSCQALNVEHGVPDTSAEQSPTTRYVIPSTG